MSRTILNKSISNCRVPCCDVTHALERIEDGWIMAVEDFLNLYEYYKTNVSTLCGKLCAKNES